MDFQVLKLTFLACNFKQAFNSLYNPHGHERALKEEERRTIHRVPLLLLLLL